MSEQPGTRTSASIRWFCAAMTALVLISGASLAAQDQKDKDKRPAPAHRTPPPSNKSYSPPRTEDQPIPHKSSPPPNPQAVHPVNPPPRQPANVPYQRPPANVPNQRPPANVPYGRPPVSTPNEHPRPAVGTTGNRPSFGGGPRPAYHGANGTEVHYHADGHPAVVRTRTGVVVTHHTSGVVRTEYVRSDRSVVVTQGAHWGYVQRPFAVGGVSYVQRTYVVGGAPRVSIYRPYVYRGVSMNIYMSSHYYAPAFYGWAYTPWVRPVAFSFGWGARPWFGFYAGYFAPYPVYAGPAYWLTDYMIAMSLQDAYNQQMQANAAPAPAQQDYGYPPAPGGEVALTPDVKQAIADEVHRQLDQERMESQAGGAPQATPAFLADNSAHVFVVGNPLDVQSSSGECGLSEGDVLQMTAPPPGNSATADLAVLGSKGQDCRKGAVVTVAIADLQDMQNHMRETLDQGLAELQAKQGQGGLPSLPPSANQRPVEAGYAMAAPPPDPNAASVVGQQAESAVQAEAEVLDQAPGPAPGAAPQSVSLGMTIDQVVSMMGQPAMVGDLGSKKIYSYGNMKVIFIDGKVADIQ